MIAKNNIEKFIESIKNVLLKTALVIIYFLGLGISKVLVILFQRDLVWYEKADESFWEDFEGQNRNIKEFKMQS